MSDATSSWGGLRRAMREAEAARPSRPDAGPVFIGDCATAADHTTLLLALWRQWDEAKDGQG